MSAPFTKRDDRSNIDKALAGWGDPLPDWIQVLAEECDATSQAKVGPRLGYKGAGVVCAVINNNYPGDLARVEDAVRGALMNATVECPVDGEITKDLCIRNQKTKLATTSNRRIRLYRACRGGCQHFKYGG
ncbi:MAG: transcriptional regulator [Alphaproteobacteria bacterium]|nr:transcriptional regulator [Alphaproteobacteria bacterium]